MKRINQTYSHNFLCLIKRFFLNSEFKYFYESIAGKSDLDLFLRVHGRLQGQIVRHS